MKSKFFLLALALAFSLSLISAIPDLPHKFYGEVKDSDGNFIDGEKIIAEFDGKSVSSRISNGNYNLTVEHDSRGDLIKFFIRGENVGNYSFDPYSSTKLNFQTNFSKNSSSGSGNSGNPKDDSDSGKNNSENSDGEGFEDDPIVNGISGNSATIKDRGDLKKVEEKSFEIKSEKKDKSLIGDTEKILLILIVVASIVVGFLGIRELRR